MPRKPPAPAETITAAKLRDDISHTLCLVQYGKVDHVIITRHGKASAALISIEKLRVLKELERK